MPATLACIAGGNVQQQWQAGRIAGEPLGARTTPFGPSGQILRVAPDEGPAYFLLARHGGGRGRPSPARVPARANLYALRDLGVDRVLAWAPGAAIQHTLAVGDLVVLGDLIDLTRQREQTFFPDRPWGYLRQFPVFCPALSATVARVLAEMKLVHHERAVAAVCEGPRLETPAEVRWLGSLGAAVVTHAFVPEVFLARELQMCYAAVCYAVQYAETGSRHHPFTGGLFAEPSPEAEQQRLASVVAAINQIARRTAAACAAAEPACDCAAPMAEKVRAHDLPDDWHAWFD